MTGKRDSLAWWDMTHDERMAEIRTRLAAMDGKVLEATPGIGPVSFVALYDGEVDRGNEGDGPWEMWAEHAEFLANAPADIAYMSARIERYEAALREAHAWSLAHGETAIPPAQAHKIRRCIEAALADDEATD